MTQETQLRMIDSGLPTEPNWFVLPETVSRYRQLGMACFRLIQASDCFTTFPSDFDDYGFLLWCDLQATLDESDEIYYWMLSQSWIGYVGLGWIEVEPKFITNAGCFCLFNHPKDYVFWRLRWG